MKPKIFIVQANHHIQQEIKCGFLDDMVKDYPVSVVFFYQENVHHQILIDSLQNILSDFPIFAGTLKNRKNNLYIDCNNQGVSFYITREKTTITEVIDRLPKIKKKDLVHAINPQKAISSQSPMMTIKLTYFARGGMALGMCWHHSIGDMHTFMQLMKAWSDSVNKQAYTLPLIVKARDEYVQENLERNGNTTAGIKYLKIRELFSLIFYLLLNAPNKHILSFYFSENELNNMKQQLSEKANQRLSRSDVLYAHIFSLISELDEYDRERNLSIAINHRSKLKFPQNISGNFISIITIPIKQKTDSFQIAQKIRSEIDEFSYLNTDFFARKEFIEKKGGIKKINRFVDMGIDPLNRTLFVTNWSNFGVYDVIFGSAKPFYFSPLNEPPFPWISVITEGFSKSSLIYSVLLPKQLTKKLMHQNNLQKIHQYRDPKEIMPEVVKRLPWLL